MIRSAIVPCSASSRPEEGRKLHFLRSVVVIRFPRTSEYAFSDGFQRFSSHCFCHRFGVRLFPAQVRDYCALCAAGEYMHLNRSALSESPATANGLIVSLERIRNADESHARAVLPVQPPSKHRWLANHDLHVSESPCAFVIDALIKVGVSSHGDIRNALIEQSSLKRILLVVKFAPDQPFFCRYAIAQPNMFVSSLNFPRA